MEHLLGRWCSMSTLCVLSVLGCLTFYWVTQILPSSAFRVMYCEGCMIWRQMEGGKLLSDRVVFHLLTFSFQEKKINLKQKMLLSAFCQKHQHKTLFLFKTSHQLQLSSWTGHLSQAPGVKWVGSRLCLRPGWAPVSISGGGWCLQKWQRSMLRPPHVPS